MSRQKMLDDLRRSGISDKVARLLKFEVLTAAQTKKLGHFEKPSYKIRYYDIDGKPTGYYRVRYLETPTGEFGRELSREARYSGPTGATPEAFFPKIPKITKWRKVAKDVSIPIWVTEGEKKAIAACLAGVHCLAFGGVAMFQSKKRGVKFLKELDDFEWSGRDVFIAYDSDKSTNANIIRDQNALANRYLERDANVMICDIPEGPGGEKAGLDDFLLKGKTPKKKSTLLAYLATQCSDEYAKSAMLHELNGEVCVIKNPGAIYKNLSDQLTNNIDRLTRLDYGTWLYDIPPTTEGGKPKEVSAFTEWLKWEHRREHDNIIYAPGQPEIVGRDLNVWKGWGVEPSKGDVKPILELVDFLFQDDPELKPWFWQWLAYPLQNPDAKMFSAIVFYGPTQGTGKTFLGEIVGDIYGPNFTLLGQDDLGASFNDVFTRKQFALADEIVAANDRKAADKLKLMITRQSITINRKWEVNYTLRDTINYMFTSNHFDAVYIERQDRRYAIVRVPDEKLSAKFYRDLRAWRENGGASKLFDHLLNIDCDGFNSLGSPPKTATHRHMIETSFSDADQWAEDLKVFPDSILTLNGSVSERSLFKPTELFTIYDPGRTKGTAQKALSNALQRAGFEQRSIHVPSMKTSVRMYAVRDMSKWKKQAPELWGKEYDSYSKATRRDKLT